MGFSPRGPTNSGNAALCGAPRGLKPAARRRGRFAHRHSGAVLLFSAGLVMLGAAGCEEPEGPSPRERSRLSIVRDRPGVVRVHGIGPIRGFAQGRDNTFMHCLELVLEATGRKIGYDELMGLSGLAFRSQFRVDGWDVGNPDPLVGEDCAEPLFQAIGLEYEVRVVRRDELAKADALRRAIARNIDRRMPSLAANIIPPEDWGIIVGYRQDRRWLCRSYNGGAERTDRPATDWPTAVVLITRRMLRPDSRAAHVASIRRAIQLFEKRRTGSYALGHRALEEWCQSLGHVGDRKYIHANFWTYIGLIDARAAAVRYLRGIAREFGPREVYISRAADRYDKEVRLLRKELKNVPAERLYPDSLPPAHLRAKQIETLRQALRLEEWAIEALKKAI